MADPAIMPEPLTTYTFKIVVEPDENAWHAYCPALVDRGGATWGETREAALRNIDQVVRMVVESLIEHGEPIPTAPVNSVQVSTEPVVSVTV